MNTVMIYAYVVLHRATWNHSQDYIYPNSLEVDYPLVQEKEHPHQQHIAQDSAIVEYHIMLLFYSSK